MSELFILQILTSIKITDVGWVLEEIDMKVVNNKVICMQRTKNG